MREIRNRYLFYPNTLPKITKDIVNLKKTAVNRFKKAQKLFFVMIIIIHK